MNCCSKRLCSIDALFFYIRVHTDLGKVWKVLEFNVEIFKALKSLENDHRSTPKVIWKKSLKTVMKNRIEEYIYRKFQYLKANFVIFFSHKDEQNALKSLEKAVILSWKSLENHSQMNPGYMSDMFYRVLFFQSKPNTLLEFEK